MPAFIDHHHAANGPSTPLDYATAAHNGTVLERVENAVKNRDVLLAYQPVMQVQDPTKPAFYEGLIRILDENHEEVRAAEFIEIIETRETGRIIDCLALELGLAALREEAALRLSINMSARSIGYPRWMKTLNDGLAADTTIAERLILEITESSAMVMPDIVSVFMANLHARGISFALDDFGAGFTAFRYFKDFYFDMVKIDGQFIRNIHKDTNNQVLVEALVMIARQFDMFTVAEAVESAEDADFLTATGIDCMQGYFLGAPVSVPPWAENEATLQAYV